MGMKARIGLLAILALAWAPAATAQPPATAPQSSAIENVIVTAPRSRPEKELDNFIIAHAAASPLLGKIARWKTGICPLTVGMSQKFGLYISQRILKLAMAVGAPLSKDEPCRPNVVVFATPEPQKALDYIRTKRPALLGFHYISQRERIATMRRPIQAWYSTATEDFWGFISADMPSGDLGYGVMSTLGGMGGLDKFAVMHTSGSRTGDGLRSEFTTAVILVDTTKIVGQEVGPVADYIAMLALSQGQYYDSCQDVPTITNLLAPGCDTEFKPAALTDIDLTYLRGLYRMNAGSSFMGERGSIEFEMKKDLGGY